MLNSRKQFPRRNGIWSYCKRSQNNAEPQHRFSLPKSLSVAEATAAYDTAVADLDHLIRLQLLIARRVERNCVILDPEVTAMRDKRAIYLSIVLEANEDGYLASVPGLQGAFAEGDTFEEAIFNCVDVVKLIAAYRSERGESLGFPSVEVTPDTRLTVALPFGVRVTWRRCAN